MLMGARISISEICEAERITEEKKTAEFNLLFDCFKFASKELVDCIVKIIWRSFLNVAFISLYAGCVLLVRDQAIETGCVLDFEASVIIHSCAVYSAIKTTQHEVLS